MPIKILARQLSVIVLSDDDPNYIASCQVFLDGDEGTIYTVNGRDFYAAVSKPGVLRGLMAEYGLSLLRATVRPAYTRLLRKFLGAEFDIRVGRRCVVYGHEMFRVELVPR